MAIKTKKGKWVRSSGKAVAVSNVRPIDREKDRTVERMFSRIERLQQQMEDEKHAIIEEIEEYKAICEDEFDASFSDNGAITLTNFSGDKQIELKVNKQIQHDEKLDLAENLMRQALNEDLDKVKSGLSGNKARGALKSLRKIESFVDWAYALTDAGNVARHRIVSLKQLSYDHPKWEKALRLINESEVVRGTRQYLYVRKRANVQDKFDKLDLNFTLI